MGRYFLLITQHPRFTLGVVLAVMAATGFGLTKLRFDSRPDAFLPPEHPALVSKKRVEEVFGLEDPMLLAVIVVDEAGEPIPGGFFRPHAAEPVKLVRDLSDEILALLDENRATWGDPPEHPVYSLATEFDVDMTSGVPEDLPFLDPFPEKAEDLEALREAVYRLELYTGVIVSEDGSAAAIFIVPPTGSAQPVYEKVRALAKQYEAPGIRLALAGEAAVRSAMGHAVVDSAIRLNPLCVAVVIVFLIIAFRNLVGLVLPMMVVGFGCAVMLGTMSWFDIPVYIITNSILVTVMSIGVADAIHILGEYYREIGKRSDDPGSRLSRAEIVAKAHSRLWLPVFVTSVTDMVGFASFFFTGIMPPLKWFGLFTALGVGATLVASFTLLPACLMFVNPESKHQRKLARWSATGPLVRGLVTHGEVVQRRAGSWLVVGIVLTALGAWFASDLRVGQSMASTFESTSRIVRDDRLLNRLFDGTYFLDVIVEAKENGGLVSPEVLRKIEALETFAESQESVNGSISVAGFSRKMNQILNDWDKEFNRIPDDAGDVREHLDLLERSASKHADLVRVIDKDYRRALVRLRLTSGEYDDERRVVEAVSTFLDREFPPDGGLETELAGRVYLDYHWVALVVSSHVRSLTLTCILIFVCLVVLFRSLKTGVLCMIPVSFAVLCVYAVMAATDIPLSVGTSMFASLSIGVGVNFPIHVIDRTRLALRENDGNLAAAYREVFSLTAKALVFNALAVCCGFLALLVSELPLMRQFGLMIALGIGSCCFASLTFLPAIIALLHRSGAKARDIPAE